MNIPDFVDWLSTDGCLEVIENDEDFAANVKDAVKDALYNVGYHSRARRIGNSVECILFEIYDAWRDEVEQRGEG